MITRPPHNGQQPIYINGRVIGHVRGDTFYKSISGSRHLLKIPPAICFDRSTLRDTGQQRAQRGAAIYDRETGKTYTASFETIETNNFPVPRGYGDQVGLGLEHWSIDGDTPVAERRAAETNAERTKLQLSLFAVEDVQ